MNPAEAVLRYAGDFIPSWAGAMSIDLMPAVLVLILCVVHASIRREGIPASSASSMTAGELMAALQMAREVEEARHAKLIEPKPDVEPVEEVGPVEDKNVTPLSSARHNK